MKTILVVEDNDAIREDVAEMLSLADYQVLTASNGKIGIEIAKKNIPDLIISDVTMPVVDGLGMLHMLRHDPRTDAIPVIFLTAKTERHEFRNAMESGADDYITKPFNSDELLKAIEHRLKRLTLVRNLEKQKHEREDCSEESLESLFVNSDIRTYMKKEIIYKEGATPRYLYYILKGKSRTSKKHEIGKTLSMDLNNTGDFLGFVALLEDGAYKETGEAMEDNTEIAMVPRKRFDELLQRSPGVAQKLIKMLARNVSEKEKHLLNIAYNTLRQKVAGALISLDRKYNVEQDKSYYIDMSREEFASIVGAAMESCIRMLGDFKNEKLIDIRKDNKIEITNFKKLEKIAG